ncbi:hypothetical protein GCM10011348_10850 [Marinobacterium nitratireducens]|uniref:DUF945 domain-containing protein n=1 Tax=Marinobacterium nitratireducens TaxID=518897 RepID=A0A918DR97_9GAMM|nr:hypothetical protein [Marinobacterium nitratireducens]GGO78586.1 hypothetical protein GCM10011348_10850 [Marinobacterium nitratireducens]
MGKLVKGLGVLLVPVAVAGGAYGYYWYQVKTSVDQLAESMAPFARLSYDRVVAGLDGTAGVSGVRLVPGGSNDAISIGSVLFHAPDPLFYLNAEERLRQEAWPEQLSLELKGLQLDLGADYLVQWEQMAEALEAQSGLPAEAGTSFEALGCGDVERFDLAATRAMGYQRLSLDARLGMQFVPRQQVLTLRSDATVDGMAQTGVAVELSTGTAVLSAQALAAAQPTLKRVTFDYSDLGYNPRRNSYCAKQADMAPDDYPQYHSGLLQAELKRLGWSVPDELVNAYADLQRPRAIMQLSAEPPPGFGPESLGTISSPEQLLDLFNLKVSVNGRRQDLSEVRWSLLDDEALAAAASGADGSVSSESVGSVASEAAAAQPEEPAEPDLVVELEAPAPEPQPPAVTITDPDVVEVMPGIVVKAKEAEKGFKPTALKDAHAYSGKPVRLRTYFGRNIEGTLLRVSNGTLEVEQRLDRGVAVFPIAADKVSELSIYR